MEERARTAPRWLPWALAALWLALGYANLARGLAHPGTAYRPWAFAHHSYSDVLALGGDRYLRGGRPLPYLEDRIEYPVLLGILLWAPSWLPGGQLAHFTASYLFLSLCLLAALALLERLPGASPCWLGCTPALLYYAGLNWDLFPIALLLAAVLALERGRPGAGGVLAGLGIAAKLWPAALLPAAAAALGARRDGAALRRLALGAGLSVLAVNLPFALAAPGRWSWFFRFNAGRGAENSIWEALGVGRPAELNALGLAVLALASLGAAAGVLAARPGERDRAVRLGAALVLVAWIASNKVWSPQYALYAFAAAALVGPPARIFLLLSAVAAVDYHLAFEVRAGGGYFRFFDRAYYAEEVVRTAGYLWLAGWLSREILRARRAPAAGTAGA